MESIVGLVLETGYNNKKIIHQLWILNLHVTIYDPTRWNDPYVK